MKKLENRVAVFIGGGSAVASVALKYFIAEGASVLQVDVAEPYFERTRDCLLYTSRCV